MHILITVNVFLQNENVHEIKALKHIPLIMRPSSVGGGRILRRTLSVRLSVCLSVRQSRACLH